MPRLQRPDGVQLHWEARGSGPPVMVVLHWAGHPRLLAPLQDDLARDHRVVLAHRVREVLPRAHVEILDDGPFNRPDLTAAVVRRITTGG